MQDNDVVEAEFEEITEEVPAVNVGTPGHIEHGGDVVTEDVTETPTEEQPKMSKAEVVAALALAVENDQLDPKTAHRIRSEMGIFQSSFTKKRTTDEKRKAKRKLQKNARKKQRK